MANINLLPWRQERREEQKKEFMIVAGGFAVLSLLIVFYLHTHYVGKIEHQKSVNNFLVSEIKILDQRIQEVKNIQNKKAELLARLSVIQSLQTDRPAVVLLFDSLAKVLPPGVNYSELQRKDKIVTFNGFADSNSSVSQLMRNIAQTNILSEPTLSIIKERDAKNSGPGTELRYYSLQSAQLNPFNKQGN